MRFLLVTIVGFWVARHLGPIQFGAFNYGLALVGMMALVAELGLEGIVRRELILQPHQGNSMVVTVSLVRLGGGSVAYAIIVASGFLGWVTAEEHRLLVVLGLMLFQPALMVSDLWFQARLGSRFTVLAQLVALGVGGTARICLIVNDAGLLAFAWVLILEAMIGVTVLWALAWREGLSFRWRAFRFRLACRFLREAWPMMLSGFAVLLYLRLDVIMLLHQVGQEAVGIYSAAVRFTEIWYFVPVALAVSVLPALLRTRERDHEEYMARLQKFYDLNAGLAYGLALPLSLAAPWLVNLAYGPAYSASASVLMLHVWSSVFVFIGVARGQFLVNEGYTYFYLAATMAGLVINAGLNWVMIPRFGPWGAALATLIAQAVAGWLSSYFFAPMRATAQMQTRALFVPFRWYHYLRNA
jgi:O-antigen/teichoic acid export membrane protein